MSASAIWNLSLRLDRASRLVLLLFVAVVPLGACEPILPMFMVLGGSATLGQSLLVLVAAIIIKCVAYVWLNRGQTAGNAFGAMLAGNLLSTVVGGFAAAVVAGIPLTGLLGIMLCAILPAQRMAAAYPRLNAVVSVAGIVVFMTALVVASLFLWGYSQVLLADHGPLALYWLLKIGFVFLGLVCGLLITVFWEEWVIARMTGSSDVRRIVMANVVTLGLVAIYAAAVVLPKRFASSNFLVDLLQWMVDGAARA